MRDIERLKQQYKEALAQAQAEMTSRLQEMQQTQERALMIEREKNSRLALEKDDLSDEIQQLKARIQEANGPRN